MPIYEYVCADCGERFDALRPIREADAPIGCRKCESRRTERTLSVFYARSGGQTVAGTSGNSCGSCSGGSCGSCGLN